MKKLLFISAFLIQFQIISLAQSNWKWGYQATVNGDAHAIISAIDQINNLYVIIPYGDSIALQDTSFSHPGIFYNLTNFVLAKYNNNGDLLKVVDINGSYNEMLGYGTKVIVDDDLSVFLIVHIFEGLTINNTYIESKSDKGSLVLLKLDKDFNLIWQKQIFSEQIVPKCVGFDISKNHDIYLSGKYYGDPTLNSVNFFDQDTVYFNYSMISLTKLNKNGNIIWNKQIFSTHHGDPYIYNSNLGKNGSFYIGGIIEFPFVIDGDTLFPPGSGSGYFDVAFLPDGNVRHTLATNVLTGALYSIIANREGNYYLSSFVSDTIIFGNDTLKYSPDSMACIIAETDTLFQPVWYQLLDNFDYTINYHFMFDFNDDTISFYSNCRNTFNFADSTYNVGDNPSIFFGKVTTDGNVVQADVAKSTGLLTGFSIKMDNCNNNYLSGSFNGELIINDDTLIQNNLTYTDAYIVKISNSTPDIFPFTDTTILISDNLLLQVPDIYENVNWSTGDTSHFVVLSGDSLHPGTHIIWVDAVNGNCIVSDTLRILVIDNSGVSDHSTTDIALYPNPAKNTLTIYSGKPLKICKVKVYNQFGQMVLRSDGNSSTLDLSNLNCGLYYVEFMTGNTKVIKKFIKQ